MAGDWLKFDVDTPEKQEVFNITVAMEWNDPDLTVGKLLKIWRWFDKHTVDGNAPRVTLSLLDCVCGVTGFAQAMLDVGWLARNEAGVCLPNFDRHNGKTAKDRCLTAKRVAKHKANAVGNARTVSAPLPREEKNRDKEEEPKTLSDAGAPGGVERRAIHLEAIEAILPVDGQEPAAVPAPRQDQDFERAWQLYPKRDGGNPRKDALSAWNARVKEGVSAEDMIAGIERYAAHMKARGKIGTPYVMQASTFFGPSARYAEAWPVEQPPAPRANGRPSINASFVPGADDNIFDQLRSDFQ